MQFILGEEDAEGSGLEPHPLFSEMETLCEVDGGQMEWKETARSVARRRVSFFSPNISHRMPGINVQL